MKIFVEEGVISKEIKFKKNDSDIYSKLREFYEKVLPEEYDHLAEDGVVNVKKLIEEIDNLKLNPIYSKKNNEYSIANTWVKINIQNSSIFTKFLLLVDLLFRVSNIYKYLYDTGYKSYLLTIYNLLTVKLTNTNTKELLFKSTQQELQSATLVVGGIW